MQLTANYNKESPTEKEEHIVRIDWQKTVPQNNAVSEIGFFGNQTTVARPKVDKWDFTVKRLKEIWGIE